MSSQTASSPIILNRILLATDFSLAGRAAFEAAVQLCCCSGASLYILNVFEYGNVIPPECGGQMLDLDSFFHDAERSMNELIQEARQQGVSCEGTIGSGVADITILEAVQTEAVQLVVLGTRAIHGFERLVFGSTAEAVLRKSSCPVYTVGPQAASQGCQLAAESGTVVFATDFHRETIEAIQEAAAFARLLKLPLHCLHVLPRGAEDGTHKGTMPAIITEALRHLADRLDELPDASICAVNYGSEISNAVVEYALRHNAKLIVLGVRRASLLASHIPAHIAYRIITEAPCPVLTVAFPNEAHDATVGIEVTAQSAEMPNRLSGEWSAFSYKTDITNGHAKT